MSFDSPRRTNLLVSAISAVALWVCLWPGPAKARSEEAGAWLDSQGYAKPSRGVIVACHGYGCFFRERIALDTAWIARAGGMLRRAQGSPAAERTALGEVVRMYTAHVARRIGGTMDQPLTSVEQAKQPGQMDCFDTTANTTSLLMVLEDSGLLRHHRVDGPQSRGVLFDGRWPHFSAVIAEQTSGARWVVDPWPYDPGKRPDIVPLEQWAQAS